MTRVDENGAGRSGGGGTTSTTTAGIPVGAVRIPRRHLHEFRGLLHGTLRTRKIRFRGVEEVKAEGEDAEGELSLVHLPPIAAAALDDGTPPDLIRYLRENGGTYLSGVRRTGNLALPATPPLASPVDGDGFTFVELFAGIGGFRLGLERGSMPCKGRCVLSVEVNPRAASIYRANFDDRDSCLAVGDVLDLDFTESGQHRSLPRKFDMLTAGFPCQPFSERGHKRGLEDEDRGQMYRELVRVLSETRPPCFLFENVVGLVTMGVGGSRSKRKRGERTTFKPGDAFERILDAFRSCGYNVDWRVVNSRHFVPQMRERVYIVGMRDDLSPPPPTGSGIRGFDWDRVEKHGLEGNRRSTVRSIMEPKDSPAVVAAELTPSQWTKVQAIHTKRGTVPSEDGKIDPDGKAPTLISNYRRAGSLSTKLLFQQSDGTRCDGVGTNRRPRFLTPRECCRVMGFPEDFNVPSSPSRDDGDEDGDATVAHFYEAVGNAVTPPVIAAIGAELMRCVREGKHEREEGN